MLGSGLTGVLYVLDEPTTGLHSHEVEKLLHILRKLVDRGDTVVVIEHHLDAMCEADTLIDFGSSGGAAGGEVVANKDSLTGQYLKTCLGL